MPRSINLAQVPVANSPDGDANAAVGTGQMEAVALEVIPQSETA